MEVSDQDDISIASHLGKDTVLPSEQEAGWSPEEDWKFVFPNTEVNEIELNSVITS
jgi:hypothetical protein